MVRAEVIVDGAEVVVDGEGRGCDEGAVVNERRLFKFELLEFEFEFE